MTYDNGGAQVELPGSYLVDNGLPVDLESLLTSELLLIEAV